MPNRAGDCRLACSEPGSAVLACAVDDCDTFALTDDYDLLNFVSSCGGNAGSITVNYTLTDSCGNGVSFASTFTIEDTTAPDTTGCNLGDLDATIECLGQAGNEQAIADWHAANRAAVLACAVDDCDTFALTDDYDLLNFVSSCGGNAGSITVNYTLTDSCGNGVSFASTFTIEDTTAPDTTGCNLGDLNATIECLGQAGNEQAIADWHAANRAAVLACAVDDCDTFELTDNYDLLNFVSSCGGNAGSITVNYTLTDSCGNGVSFASTFTIEDTTAPDTTGCNLGDLDATIECLGQVGNEQAIADWHASNRAAVLACAVDDCDTFALTDDYDLLNFVSSCGGNAGSITVNYTLTDSCGNGVSFASTFTIEDTTAPDTTGCNLGDLDATIECLGQVGNEQAIADWHSENRAAVLACAVDDCDTFALTDDYDLLNFVSSCGGNAGSITVNYTLTDSCGNGVSFASTFTIEDTTAPDTTGCNLGDLDATIECLGQAGNEQAIADWHAANRVAVLACAVDDCDTFELTDNYDLLNFVSSCGGNAGSITVNYTLTDSCGNGVSFASTFTIEDTTAPDTTGCNLGDLDATIECLGQAGNEQAIADWHAANRAAVLACAVDDCDTFALTDDYDLLNFVSSCGGNAGSITVNYTLTDSCGNGVSFASTFTIEDTTAPDTTGCNLGDLNAVAECFGAEANEALMEVWHQSNLQILQSCVIEQCDSLLISDDFDLNNFVVTCGQNAGYLTVNYVLNDYCGNSSGFSATLTIEDTNPPVVINCDITQLNDSIECLGTIANEQAIRSWNQSNIDYLTNCATDDCNDVLVTSDLDLANFVEDCSPNTGSLVAMYTISDGCGYSTTLSGSIVIYDLTPPHAIECVEDITIDFYQSPDPDSIGWPNYRDICDPDISVTYQDDSLGFEEPCDDFRYIIRSFFATDNCGNTDSSCVQTIKIECCDLEEFAFPGDTTIYCGDSIPTEKDIYAKYPGLDLKINTTSHDGSCQDLYFRVIEVEDQCSHEYTITVLDTTSPELYVTPNDTFIYCGDPLPEPTYEVSDNCTEVEVTFEEKIGECECGQIIEWTWTAKDACYNMTSITRYIEIRDTVPPVIEVASEDMSGLTEGDTMYVYGCGMPQVNMNDFSATDDCCTTQDSTYDRFVSFKRCDIHGYDQLWECGIISKDLCGNESRFVFYVAQIDTTPPTILNVPEDVTLACDDTIPPVPSDVTSIDDCQTETRPEFEEIIEIDSIDSTRVTITRRWFIYDNCENFTEAIQKITMCGNPENPDTIIKSSITGLIWNDANRDGIRDQEESLMDSVPLSLFAVDDLGNSTLLDVTTSGIVTHGQYQFNQLTPGKYKIEISLPDSLLLTQSNVGDEGTDSDYNENSYATDIIDLDSVDVSLDAGVIVKVEAPVLSGIMGVIWEDADSNGIRDPEEILLDSILVNLLEVVSDGMEVQIDQHLTSTETKGKYSFDGLELGHYRIEVILPDSTRFTQFGIGDESTDSDVNSETGKSDIIQLGEEMSLVDAGLVRVITDTTSQELVLHCAPDVTTTCRYDLVEEPTWEYSCDVSLSYLDQNELDSCGLGQIFRTWTATACDGQVRECAQVITVIDTTPPVFDTCSSYHFITCGDSIGLDTLDISDLCEGATYVTFEDTIIVDSCNTTITTRTWTAWDCAGNTATCEQKIVYTDTIVPQIVCPADTSVQCWTDSISSMADAFDNCDIAPVVSFEDELQLDSCGQGRIIRTWSATDCIGNVASCIQTITVADTMSPVIICPPDTTVSCRVEELSFMVIVEDNCDPDPTFNYVDVVELDSCGLGIIERNWTATDCSGNTSICVQRITVVDTIAPTAKFSTDTTLSCEALANYMTPEIPIIDNCDPNPSVTYSDSVLSNDCNGPALSRTWTVRDCAGNSASHVQIISVMDTFAPVLVAGTCPADTILIFGESLEEKVPEYVDNCSPAVDISFRDDSIGFSENCKSGTILRTFFAEDQCQNVDSSCTQVITFRDEDQQIEILPVLADIEIFCGEDLPSTDSVVAAYPDYGVALEEITFDLACGRKIERHYTFTNECLAFTHLHLITINDTLAPIMTVPPDTVIELSASLPLDSVVAHDDCSEVTVEFVDIIELLDGCDKLIIRSWSATDGCGNTTLDTQRIYMRDMLAPVIDVKYAGAELAHQDTLVIYHCMDEFLPNVNYSVIDSCMTTDTMVANIIDSTTCDSNQYLSLYEVTISATDLAGNEVSIDFYTRVYDTIPPTFTEAPGTVTVNCDEEVPVPFEVKVEDDCGGNVDIQLEEQQIFDADDSTRYALIRTWSAEDQCANQSTHTQIIRVCGFDTSLLLNSIEGMVWFDQNHDGLRFEHETGVNGVKVQLYTMDQGLPSLSDSAISSVSIDSLDGHYRFDGLQPGRYMVKFVLPDSLYFSFSNAGDDNIDSDALETSGETDWYTLGYAQQMTNIDAGILYKESLLPPEIVYFEATGDTCDNYLLWATQDLETGDSVILEKSYDGIDYFTIYESAVSLIDQDYLANQFLDDTVLSKQFYQLTVIIADGRFATQAIFKENPCEAADDQITTYPNPTSSTFTLEIKGSSSQKIELVIYDVIGKFYQSITLDVKAGLYREEIDFSRFVTGTYILRFRYNGKTYNEMILKI